MSSAPPFCTSESFPDRSPSSLWGYRLPQWIPEPVSGSPYPDLAAPDTQSPSWSCLAVTGAARPGQSSDPNRLTVTQTSGQCWWRQMEAGRPGPPCRPAATGRRGSATAPTCRAAAGSARSAASPSPTPAFTRSTESGCAQRGVWVCHKQVLTVNQEVLKYNQEVILLL